MNIKLGVFICILLMMILSACKPSKENEDEVDKSEEVTTTSQEVVIETTEVTTIVPEENEDELVWIEDENHPLYSVVPGHIKNRDVLNYLYNRYMYDAITTVANHGSFTSAEEITPNYLIRFAAQKYFEDHPKERGIKALSLEQLNPYFKKMFNIDAIDVSNLSASSFNQETGEVVVQPNYSSNEFVEFDEPNSWNIVIKNYRMNKEHVIIADMFYYFWDNNQEVEELYTLTLAPHTDGSGDYYFQSGTSTFYEIKTIEFETEYEEVDFLDRYRDEKGILQANISFYGESMTHVYWNIHELGFGGKDQLIGMNKESKTIEYIKDFTDSEAYIIDVKKTSDYGLVFDMIEGNEIILLSENLEPYKNIVLPELITELMVEDEYDYDTESYNSIFLGFDATDNYTKYTYATQDGVFYYDTITAENQLIYASYEADNEFTDVQLIGYPRFVGENNHIIAILPGWEWDNGYVYFNGLTKEIVLDDNGLEAALHILYEGEEYYVYYQYLYLDNIDKYELVVKMRHLDSGEVFDAPSVFDDINFSEYDVENKGYRVKDHGILIFNYDYNTQEGSIQFVDKNYTLTDHVFEYKKGDVKYIGMYEDSVGLHIILDYSSNGGEYGTISWNIERD